MATDEQEAKPVSTPSSERPRSFFARNSTSHQIDEPETRNIEEFEKDKGRPTKWSMGVLNDPNTHEVPGSVLLLTGHRNEPLGLRNAPARTSGSSLPQPTPSSRRQSVQQRNAAGKKKTPDGAIILEPQPEESSNDPLNWPQWRRDLALLSLGIYCMVGGGMTPILAAGFTNVAQTYHVTTPKVALTTGLYMMGLGVGSVVASPTAILFGKRPVYLVSSIVFIGTSVWCAASPSYNSLLLARIFQGISVSPVECLPSATIAEIFFLHERAYRIGIYGLLLLGGKNLVPLVSAAIIQTMGWRWVFWVVAIVVGFCFFLLLLFVPESFWDRTPVPKSRKSSHHPNASRPSLFSFRRKSTNHVQTPNPQDRVVDVDERERSRHVNMADSLDQGGINETRDGAASRRPTMPSRGPHVGFASEDPADKIEKDEESRSSMQTLTGALGTLERTPVTTLLARLRRDVATPLGGAPPTPALHNFNSPWYKGVERSNSEYFEGPSLNNDGHSSFPLECEEQPPAPLSREARYTPSLRSGPRRTFVQQLKVYNGRLRHDNWFKVAFRPFILYAYPAVLWSAVVYSCAVGWLIVLSESVAVVFRSKQTYGFSALSTGLIYLSPFIGGILGTAVAGKVSDIIVRFMAKRNGGLYEPEFRLVMAIPVAITTVIGLMGFGWSAEVHDAWIVPTIFFGVISFGCSLGATTAITFCVDSYRQYAGEALVTLNFSKNIFHGLVFSLFLNKWLEKDGSKDVFMWLGVIQLVFMVFTIPMYIFGKRARMWTYRMNLMEKF